MNRAVQIASRIGQALLGSGRSATPLRLSLPFGVAARRGSAAEVARTVVVSSRLPIVVDGENGAYRIRAASGGLVRAMGAVLRRRGGRWVGWPGTDAAEEAALRDLLHRQGLELGYELWPVVMSREEIEGFYQGYCNEIIWPLFHDLQSQCNFVPDYWTQYATVREKFAEIVAQRVDDGDFIWIQDYHLMGLGQCLRERGLDNPLGFFLHIPFPPPDIYGKLPWRTEVLEGMLYHDVIGFQTPHDRANFLDCVRALLPEAQLRARRAIVECQFRGRMAQIGAFPIGIDYDLFAEAAETPAVGARAGALREQFPAQQLILGLDRLDYTKGIPCRLKAFHLALKRYPELQRRVTLLQVVVPSREAVPEYQELKAQIERLVTQINGEFTQPGWVPIHYIFRPLDWEDLVSYYRVADVALVTPLKDGMNLVAKEYCACQVEGDGVLILSEFAGAAVQLRRHALLVNPYDLDRVAYAIHEAVNRSLEQREPSMRRLRRMVRRQNVFWWADRFLGACGMASSQSVSARVRRYVAAL